MTSPAVSLSGRWTGAERARLAGVVTIVLALNVAGWASYLYWSRNLAAAGSFAGAGTLAYVLGVRHAFDADHIAAIDDTTRLMMQRGRRPVGVGFFFAMGHSSVVLMLALVVALATRSATASGVAGFRAVGGVVSALVAMCFLLLVASLNLIVLTGVVRLWRALIHGEVSDAQVDQALVNRGLVNRMIGGRARNLITESWHMFPVGVLFGLGLETASEVSLLALSASTASTGGLPALAVLTLPLLFAAGMSALDTADSLLMSRAYSWAFRSPGRRLYYNMATTGMTVLVGFFVGSVYLAQLLVEHAGLGGPLRGYAAIGDHFELLGYVVVGLFVACWALAGGWWRFGGLARRYGGPR